MDKKVALRIKRNRLRAENAIAVLARALDEPYWKDIRPAISSELQRMLSALDSPELLESIYHRNGR